MAKNTRKPKVTDSAPAVNPAEELKSKLINGGCQKAIEPLEAADMLDAELLQEGTVESLVALGLTQGMARKVKKLFPSAEAEEIEETTAEEPATKDDSEKSIAKELGLDMGTMMLLMAGGGNLADLVDPVTLISSYNPRKPGHPVTRILKTHYGDKHVIAFRHGTKQVAVSQVGNYLRELEEGFPEVEFIEVDGLPAKLYPVGVIPDNLVSENPLVPNAALRGDDEKCSVTGRAYKEVPLEIRQFLRVGLDVGEIRIMGADQILNIDLMNDHIDHAHDWKLLRFRQRYPRTSIKYEELKTQKRLPLLSVELGSQPQKPVVQSPQQQQQYSSGGGIPWRDRQP